MYEMNKTNQLFFELIQVSLGTRKCLSHTLSADEWGKLYDMAKKQSLLGICFAGVQKLKAQRQASNSWGDELGEMLYLQWLGMAAKIQQRNEVVNLQCVELQNKLATDGLLSCILKGQGVAQMYSESLRGLRQSGDIDVWVMSRDGESENEHIARVVKYAKGFDPLSHFSGKHIDLSVFDDTEVELHVTPAKMNCPWHNKLLQRWFRVARKKTNLNDYGFTTPSVEFNVVYLLLHCYDHLLFEGVGLRQTMDYYWTISNSALKNEKIIKAVDTLKSLGLMRFASAMMWVLGYVFALKREHMICEPNEEEGRFLLNEIMTGGNFGKYGKDGVMEGHAKGKIAFFMARMKRNCRFFRHYPSEIIWSPYAIISHYVKKEILKY